MHGKDGAEAFEGFLEFALTVVGLTLYIRLRDAEFKFVLLDRVDVEDRAAGGFDRAADSVIGAPAIHQTTDRAAGRIIDAGHAAGTDGDKAFFLGGDGSRHAERQSGDGQTSHIGHVILPCLTAGCLGGISLQRRMTQFHLTARGPIAAVCVGSVEPATMETVCSRRIALIKIDNSGLVGCPLGCRDI